MVSAAGVPDGGEIAARPGAWKLRRQLRRFGDHGNRRRPRPSERVFARLEAVAARFARLAARPVGRRHILRPPHTSATAQRAQLLPGTSADGRGRHNGRAIAGGWCSQGMSTARPGCGAGQVFGGARRDLQDGSAARAWDTKTAPGPRGDLQALARRCDTLGRSSGPERHERLRGLALELRDNPEKPDGPASDLQDGLHVVNYAVRPARPPFRVGQEHPGQIHRRMPAAARPGNPFVSDFPTLGTLGKL